MLNSLLQCRSLVKKATKGERKLCHSSEAFEGEKKIRINLECRTFIAYSG